METIDPGLREAAGRLLAELGQRGLMLAVAESCTGGLLAAALTSIPGSSQVFERGFVSYTNEAKLEMLGVAAEILERYGAVSEACARAMASGALKQSHTSIAVAVTGIAGPGGGSETKPVGLVHFAAARKGGSVLHRERRFGDLGRSEIQRLSVLEAMDLVGEAAGLVATV